MDDSQRLTGEVRDWLARATGGPRDLVLAPQALRLVETLAQQTGPMDLQQVQLIALAHWLRYQHLPEGEDQADLELATHWFGHLFPHACELVPSVLHAHLAENVPPAGDGPDDWNAEAARYLTSACLRTVEVLQRAIRLLEQAERAPGTSAADRSVFLINLCSAQQTHYQRFGATEALVLAVDAGERAAAVAPDDRRAAALGNLGNALRVRYEALGHPQDLDGAIDRGRDAVRAGLPDDLNLPTYRSSLGSAVQARYDRTGLVEDLQESLILAQDAVRGTSQDSPARAGRLSNLGNGFRLRYLALRTPSDLDAASAAGGQAMSAATEDDPERAAYASNLASALRERFALTGSRSDLDRAIALAEGAAEAVGPSHPRHPGYVSNLAGLLRERADLTGSRTDLDRAADLGAVAEAALAAAAPDRPVVLSTLGSVLSSRYEATGQRTDIERAVDVMREAVELAGGPEAARDEALLGHCLRLRFEDSGRPDDLEQALKHGRLAVVAGRGSPVHQPAYLAMLANALHSQYEHTGRLESLDEAILRLRRAITLSRETTQERARFLSNLCGLLTDHYLRTGRDDDLEEAVLAGKDAVADLAPGHPLRPVALANLGTAQLVWFRVSHHRLDLQHGTDHAVAAWETLPDDHPLRARHASNAAAALFLRYEHEQQPGLLTRAHAAAESAVALTDSGSVYRAGRLGNLAEVLAEQHELDPTAGTLDRALDLLAEGAEMLSSPPIVRARLGRRLARLAARNQWWERADQAWTDVLALVPVLVERSLAPNDQQRHLELLSGFGPEAAAVRIRRGDVQGAWDVLEAGRGVLLGQALEFRADQSDLRTRYPRIHERYSELREILGADLDPARPVSDAAARRQAETIRVATQDMTRLLGQIRELPGLERFARAPSARDMRASAGDGTVVALITTTTGAFALLLTGRGVDARELDVEADEMVIQVNAFLAAEAEPTGFAANATRAAVLVWVWERICEPVLHHLGHTGPPPGTSWPRIWWMATGPLGVLPLHAAGRAPGSSSADSVLDRVVSSYAPTLRVLAYQRQARPPVPLDALVVGAGTGLGLPPLRRAVAEAVAVAGIWRCEPFLDDAATPETLLPALARATHVHFACHAVTEVGDPGASRLTLGQRSMTVRQLAGVQARHGVLAYLSACRTAFTGTRLLDESIHIASALQIAGFAHVVGTLWAVSDDDAPGVALTFHREFANGTPEGIGPAETLHRIVRDLRHRYPRTISLWAAYAHFGT